MKLTEIQAFVIKEMRDGKKLFFNSRERKCYMEPQTEIWIRPKTLMNLTIYKYVEMESDNNGIQIYRLTGKGCEITL